MAAGAGEAGQAMTDYRTVAYKGCTIAETGNWTSDHRGRNLALYAISGRYEKAAGLRPFITSIREAREWISDNDAMAAASRLWKAPQDDF